jgi:hypothetical protein
MSTTNSNDPLGLALRALPGMDVNPRRASEVCDRAVDLLRRNRSGKSGRVFIWRPVRMALEPVLAAALSAGFVAWVVEQSIAVLCSSRAGVFWP